MHAQIAQWLGKRDTQEDAYAVKHFPNGSLLLVCDGMGGHRYGKQASECASKSFVADFTAQKEQPMATRLRHSLDAANAAIAKLFSNLDAYGGCTLVACFVGAGVAWWVSVGDSPLLLWRHGRMIRLNQDHSMRSVYESMLGVMPISQEELVSGASVLRSALTGEKMELVDAPPTPYPLLPGDKLIVGSDGVEDLLLQRPLPLETTRLLNGQHDNLAAVIVEACRLLDRPYADNTTVISVQIP